jgi:exosome complex RNA-binding protein Csl4
MNHNVPVQSLIDHIKTAIDVDPWAKEMAEELLKKHEQKQVDIYGKEDWYGFVCVCPDCQSEWMGDKDNTHFCPNCGRAVKCE